MSQNPAEVKSVPLPTTMAGINIVQRLPAESNPKDSLVHIPGNKFTWSYVCPESGDQLNDVENPVSNARPMLQLAGFQDEANKIAANAYCGPDIKNIAVTNILLYFPISNFFCRLPLLLFWLKCCTLTFVLCRPTSVSHMRKLVIGCSSWSYKKLNMVL